VNSKSTPASGASSTLAAQGRQIFQAHTCSACHGPSAQGTTIAPPLAGIGHYFSQATFSSLIHHPRPQMTAKGMPPAPLSNQQTHALWTYLNSMPVPAHRAPGVPAVVLFANAAAPVHHAAAVPARAIAAAVPVQPAPMTAPPQPKEVAVAATGAQEGNATAGRAIFQAHTCSACHGPTAQGTAIAPPLAGIGHYFSEQTFSSLIHHPRPQMTAKGMPPAPLSNQQTNNLWAYLNSMPVPAHRAPGVPAVVIFKGVASQTAQPSTPSHQIAAVHSQTPTAAAHSNPAPAQPVAKPVVQQVALSGPAAAGEKIFNSRGCIACHGEGGVGTPLAISLIGITNTVPHNQLIALIRQPNAKMKAGGMPTFGFDNTQLNDVVAYLETLKKPTAGAAKSIAAVQHHVTHKLTPLELAGRRVYFKERCSTCHGDGSMQGTAAAPSLTATASELPPSMIQHLLLHPSNAMRSNGMPAIDLNHADMSALIAFVRSLRYNR
jgi:mono/diheme cytochrome c family protein